MQIFNAITLFSLIYHVKEGAGAVGEEEQFPSKNSPTT